MVKCIKKLLFIQVFVYIKQSVMHLQLHCHVLCSREGPSYTFEGQSVSRRLEQLVTRAGLHKQWGVVRLCSALLGKLVDSLAPSITSILVRGKQVCGLNLDFSVLLCTNGVLL